jgi:hypothetical protein
MDMVGHPESKSKEPTPEQALLLRSIADFRKMRERLIGRLLESERCDLPELAGDGNLDTMPISDLLNTVEAFSIVSRNLIRANLRARESSPFLPVIQFTRKAEG